MCKNADIVGGRRQETEDGVRTAPTRNHIDFWFSVSSHLLTTSQPRVDATPQHAWTSTHDRGMAASASTIPPTPTPQPPPPHSEIQFRFPCRHGHCHLPSFVTTDSFSYALAFFACACADACAVCVHIPVQSPSDALICNHVLPHPRLHSCGVELSSSSSWKCCPVRSQHTHTHTPKINLLLSPASRASCSHRATAHTPNHPLSGHAV